MSLRSTLLFALIDKELLHSSAKLQLRQLKASSNYVTLCIPRMMQSCTRMHLKAMLHTSTFIMLVGQATALPV
jgi:hypothetical protein